MSCSPLKRFFPTSVSVDFARELDKSFFYGDFSFLSCLLELGSIAHTCLLLGSSESYCPLSGAQLGILCPLPELQCSGGRYLAAVPDQTSLPRPETEGRDTAQREVSLLNTDPGSHGRREAQTREAGPPLSLPSVMPFAQVRDL